MPVFETNELHMFGTIPLSNDPDNDGFPDLMDERPFSPDDPPAVEALALDGDWSKGVRARVASRHGVRDVRVFTWSAATPNPDREHVPEARHDAESPEWRFRFSGMSQPPVRIRIDANDTLGTQSRLELKLNRLQVGSPPEETTMEVARYTPSHVRAVAFAAPLVNGAARCFANPDCLVGVASGVAAAAYLVASYVNPDPESPETPTELRYDWVMSTPIVLSWGDGGTPRFGCRPNLVVTQGPPGSTYTRRGRLGMLSENPHYQQQPFAQPMNALKAHVALGAQTVEFDEDSGAIVYYDSAAGLLHIWSVSFHPRNCQWAEVWRYNKVQDPPGGKANWDDLWRGTEQGWSIAKKWALRTLIAEILIDPFDIVPKAVQRIEVYDAAGDLHRVFEGVFPSIPSPRSSRLASWGNESAYEMLLFEFSLRTVWVHTQLLSPNPPPRWFWGTMGEPAARINAPFKVIPSGGLALVDDQAPSTAAWNDLASISSGHVLERLAGPSAAIPLVQASAGILCAWYEAHKEPGSERWAFIASGSWSMSAYRRTVLVLADTPEKLELIADCG